MSASDSTLEIDAPEIADDPGIIAPPPIVVGDDSTRTLHSSPTIRHGRSKPTAAQAQPAAKPAPSPPPAPPAAKKSPPSPPAPPKEQAEKGDKGKKPLAEEADDPAAPAEQAAGPIHWRSLVAMPPWLVSTVVHLLMIIILALIVIPPKPKPSGTVITAVAAEQFELIEPTKIEVVELQDTQIVTTAVSSSDLTSTSLADVGSLSAAPAAISSGDLEIPAADQIGDLFMGDGGSKMGVAVDGAAKGAAQFFGVKASGRRFVFIVDSSNSMRGAKFEAAKEELMYSIRRLSKDQAFYILFFDHDAAKMTLPPNKEPELLCIPATTQNINKAEEWVKSVVNEGRTDPFDCVQFALDIVPDAIYLLTDGIFTDKGMTERFLHKNNMIDEPIDGSRPKVVIHTVCFWDRAGEEPLQRIAKDYKGSYRYVPPAGKKK